MFINQGMINIASKPPEPQTEVRSIFSIVTLRRIQPCQHLGLGLVASRLWDNTFLFLKSPGWWYFVIAVLGNNRATRV